MNITVDYDGPSLSDTSSLTARTEPENDSVTVSSRDTTGLLVQKMKTIMNGGRSTVQDFHSLSGLESESDASAFDKRYPADPSAVFERLKLSESSESIKRNTQWLRDQTSRAITVQRYHDTQVCRLRWFLTRAERCRARSLHCSRTTAAITIRTYYTYTFGSSLSAASASAAHDDVSIGEHGSHRVADWPDPKLHWLASQKTLAQPQSKSGSSNYLTPSSSLNRQSASLSTPDPLSRTADTPPEVRQLVPPACTDCSACGVFLDAFCYVYSTCGERTPRPRASPGANGHAIGRARRVRTSSCRKPSPACPRPLPTLPSTPSASSASSSSTARRTLSQLRHAAPRKKGYFRHVYLEKLLSASGWKDVEQDNISECTICNTSLTAQVHEIHSSHAFLDVPDRPHRSRSEPDLELTNNLNDDGLGDKCRPCLMDIVCARFRCATCELVDICSNCECSNCEVAGLPGNLDTDDGGHNTSHIMIKIPIPLNSSKVQTASRRARQLWTGRDSLYVQCTPSRRVRADSLREADAVTIIGSGSKHARGGRCDHKALDLRIACKGCNQSNVGVRFQSVVRSSYCSVQCANCEQQSYLLHDPMHIFFKLPQPVDRPIESQFAILPILYVPIALPSRPADRLNSSHPKACLATLYHNVALCDRCMDRIKGVWFRCMYCAKDLCDVCENLNPHAHDRTHFFYVFKAPVNTLIVAELDNLEGSPPALNYPVYYS
ncbi:hypothetical protein DFH11DRAFT_1691207 [Phellopilus nigrolimitatus]|nr:hypothetical protein DFH11DRAFT_1691207 [Phellopilus nigrolimitatus]